MTILKQDQGGEISYLNKEVIAVVEVNGIIMDSRKVIDLLQKSERDKNVKAIIVRVNSPGGAVAPTQEIYSEIRRIDSSYKNKSKRKKTMRGKNKNSKPVYTSFSSIAASGGYYIGAAGRKVFSNPGTLTGSIGVIMQFFDLSQVYKTLRVKPETIKAGKFKDIGSSYRTMNVNEKKLLESMTEVVHKQFIQDIIAVRGSKVRESISKFSQGQIFSGEEAKKYGLVDELMGLWEVGRWVHKELKLKSEFQLKFIESRKKRGFVDWVQSVEGIINMIKPFVSRMLGPAFLAQSFSY